jgi:DNA gyrase inhibitor GyrI
MNLTKKNEPVIWPLSHYIFLEKIGPFQETAQLAWQSLHAQLPTLAMQNKVTGHMSLFKVEPHKMTYRAGVCVAEKPSRLPENFQHVKLEGGKYICFVLTGSYANLPEACGKVFEIIAAEKIQTRNDFCIENYLNNPATTPEDQLITEILVPIL